MGVNCIDSTQSYKKKRLIKLIFQSNENFFDLICEILLKKIYGDLPSANEELFLSGEIKSLPVSSNEL